MDGLIHHPAVKTLKYPTNHRNVNANSSHNTVTLQHLDLAIQQSVQVHVCMDKATFVFHLGNSTTKRCPAVGQVVQNQVDLSIKIGLFCYITIRF